MFVQKPREGLGREIWNALTRSKQTETRAGVTTTYTYDANGNRASKAAGGTTETYTVDDADKLTNIKVGTTTIKSYGYDAAGRTTSVVSSAGTTTLAYDYEGRISTITYPSSATNSFTYNGLDTRVGKVDSAGTTTYRRDGDYVLAPVLEAGGTKFTPGISRRTGTTSAFYHADRLGSNTRQTSTAQGSIASRQYDAFGNLAATSGTWTGSFGFAGGFGYQEDSDSGLQLLGHRYYDSSTGRFLTRDPIKDGRNWYSYCENNPLKFIDFTGLSLWTAAEHFLYVLLDEGGNVLKGGISHQPEKRYRPSWLKKNGVELQVVAKAPTRSEILEQERLIVGTDPGPWNKEWWAGRLKDLIEMVDPTPIGIGTAGGEALVGVVAPYVEDKQEKREQALHYWLEDE